MFLDIHSHILHNIDDGAKDLNESLALLEAMYSQGITDVIATPHFNPMTDALENFSETAALRLEELKKASNNNMPNIYLGCEVFYYCGISKVASLRKLTLSGLDYILLEPDFYQLNTRLQRDLLYMKDSGITPIIAHIERYHKERGYKKLISFVKENGILTQVNASSFTNRHYTRTLKKLVNEDAISFIGTDTHSLEHRPPMLEDAFAIIEEKFGAKYKQKLYNNSQELLEKITLKGN